VDFARGAAIAGRVFYVIQKAERRDQLIVIDLLIERVVFEVTGRWKDKGAPAAQESSAGTGTGFLNRNIR